MALNPDVMKAVEQLNYRVTVGDVAARAGLDVKLAEQGLLALASDAGGHLQVAESGDVVYQFPKDFRSVLKNKDFRLQLQAWWDQVWRVLFYLIRISFGIVLILSILLILAAISIIVIASSSSNNDDRGIDIDFSGFNGFGQDFLWIFYPSYYQSPREHRRLDQDGNPKLNFLEAVFSFLFGDGNPNFNVEERRWRTIGNVIRKNQGAVVAEQISPYLDQVSNKDLTDNEDYMLPVLTRFNGQPEVSPDGELVYYFPELQTTVDSTRPLSVPAFLKEQLWAFSQARGAQLVMAGGLGVVNLVGAIVLGSLLAGAGGIVANVGGLLSFVQAIYWVILGYGLGFLGIPALRYFWIKQKNRTIAERNKQRQQKAAALQADNSTVQQKLTYAQQFAKETVITQQDLLYTTERGMLEQDAEQVDRIDAEWQQRLTQGH